MVEMKPRQHMVTVVQGCAERFGPRRQVATRCIQVKITARAPSNSRHRRIIGRWRCERIVECGSLLPLSLRRLAGALRAGSKLLTPGVSTFRVQTTPRQGRNPSSSEEGSRKELRS